MMKRLLAIALLALPTYAQKVVPYAPTPVLGTGYYTTGQQYLALANNLATAAGSGTVPYTPTPYLLTGYDAGGIATAAYVSGGAFTGAAGTTCTLSSFNNGSTSATGTLTLTSSGGVQTLTPIVITAVGTSATSAPTTATLGNGTATCSGTATIQTTIGAYIAFATDASGNLITSGGGGYTAAFPGINCATSSTAGTICTAQQVQTANLPQPLTVTAEWQFNQGSGTTVTDITGNGHTATFCVSSCTTPAWTTAGVNLCTTSSCSQPSYLTTNLTTWGSSAWYICTVPGALPNSLINNNGSNAYASSVLWGATTTTDGIAIALNPSGTIQYGFSPALDYYPNGPPTTSGTQTVGGCHTFVFTLGASADTIYVDGVQVSYQAQSGQSSHASTTGTYQIGCGFSCAGQHYFIGTVVYGVIAAGQWTAQNIADETRYVQQKVAGRGLNLYSTGGATGRLINAIGDSLSIGVNGTTPAWYNYLTTTNTYTTTAIGLTGTMAYDNAAMFQQRVLSYMSPVATQQYCHVWLGTNDIANLSLTGAQIWAGLKLLGQECLAAGGFPIVATIIDRGGYSAAIAAANLVIRQNALAQGSPFVALHDLAEIPVLSPNGTNNANTTYYTGDALHLTGPNALCGVATGYAIICHSLSNVVNLLDGSTASAPQTLTATGNIGTNRYNIANCGTTCTLTLPDCTAITGQVFSVGSIGAGVVTMNAATTALGASVTINGASTFVLPASTAPATHFLVTLTSNTAGGCNYVTQ